MRPTRVTDRSSTLLDHIYVSNDNLYIHWGTLNLGLSDHALIYTCRKKAKVNKEKDFKVIRCYRNFVPELFAKDVEQIDWSPVYNEPHVDSAIEQFYTLFMFYIDLHMPLKRVLCRIDSAPWVTCEYLSFRDRSSYFASLYDKCPCHLHDLLDKNRSPREQPDCRTKQPFLR